MAHSLLIAQELLHHCVFVHEMRQNESGVELPYDSMADDPNTNANAAHVFEAHFDRHVWIYRENPHSSH